MPSTPWTPDDPPHATLAAGVWIVVGLPGFAGADKARRRALLDERFGGDGWRSAHVVRGKVVDFGTAIAEYEHSYRCYLRDRPALVAWLTAVAGNVYDDSPSNVFDDDYVQPHTAMNHYQDISVRRVISELAADPAWPTVTAEGAGEATDLRDLGSGSTHRVPRATGFQGDALLQIRGADSPGYVLNPAVVPAHDPSLVTTLPGRSEWYHTEGCAHLSVEAFWQMSKVVEVRYDRFLALSRGLRSAPLAGL